MMTAFKAQGTKVTLQNVQVNSYIMQDRSIHVNMGGSRNLVCVRRVLLVAAGMRCYPMDRVLAWTDPVTLVVIWYKVNWARPLTWKHTILLNTLSYQFWGFSQISLKLYKVVLYLCSPVEGFKLGGKLTSTICTSILSLKGATKLWLWLLIQQHKHVWQMIQEPLTLDYGCWYSY